MLIDWKSVKKILIVRLRSIGDTVLSTPTILALREYLPDTQIDILLEDWVAPVLKGMKEIDEVITVSNSSRDRIKTGLGLRGRKYDVVINLHGGSTAGLLTKMTGAKHRIGYKGYRFPSIYTDLFPPASEFWQREFTHSAEQQAALIGFAGVHMDECPKTHLNITKKSSEAVEKALRELFDGDIPSKFVLIHPSAATKTKQWSEENFAHLIDYLESKGLPEVLISTPDEKKIIGRIEEHIGRKARSLSSLGLPEVTALSGRAALFVGNDSGIAHIAAAVETPTVVIFGSSNVNHWKPWTNAPNRVVRIPFDCQPCRGDICREFGEPRCILEIEPNLVYKAVDELLG